MTSHRATAFFASHSQSRRRMVTRNIVTSIAHYSMQVRYVGTRETNLQHKAREEPGPQPNHSFVKVKRPERQLRSSLFVNTLNLALTNTTMAVGSPNIWNPMKLKSAPVSANEGSACFETLCGKLTTEPKLCLPHPRKMPEHTALRPSKIWTRQISLSSDTTSYAYP